MGAFDMESLTQTQIFLAATEAFLVLAGLAVWFRRPVAPDRPAAAWNAPLTDTLMLGWGVLLGAFLGQLAGLTLLRALPPDFRASEATQVLAIGTWFHGGCIGAWVAVHAFVRRKGRPFSPVNETPVRFLNTVRGGFVTFLSVLPVVLAVGLLWGMALRGLGLPVEQQDLVGVFSRTDSKAALAGLLTLAIVVAPLSEELLFRAGVFRILKGRIGRWPAIVASSTLFALLHASWAGFAPLFCLGAVFCIAYERSRNIAVPMIAHGIFNLNSIVLIVMLPPELLQ